MIEFLIEGVLTLVLELVAEVATDGVARTLRSRTGRLLASALVGVVGGLLWGWYLREQGQTATPRTLWVSATFALVAVAASYALRRAGVERDSDDIRLAPWRWTPHQWEGFALLNVAIAAGVTVGFNGG